MEAMIVSFLIFAGLKFQRKEKSSFSNFSRIYFGTYISVKRINTCGNIKDFIIVIFPFNDKFLDVNIESNFFLSFL